MRTLAIALAGTLLALALPVATADHQDAETCTVDTAIAVGDLYVDERGTLGVPGSGAVLGGGTWFYMESNGVEGLQLDGADKDFTGLFDDSEHAGACAGGDDLIW